MKKIFAFIIGSIVGIFVTLFVLGKQAVGPQEKQAVKTSDKSKKGKAKQKILDLLQQQGRVTNNDVENLIGVSDATATNYLDELEEEGLIVQQGKTGRSVFYTLN